MNLTPTEKSENHQAVFTAEVHLNVLSRPLTMALSSCARILGVCLTNHSPPALFFFFSWRLGHAHLFHSLGQDQYTVAQPAETTG